MVGRRLLLGHIDMGLTHEVVPISQAPVVGARGKFDAEQRKYDGQAHETHLAYGGMTAVFGHSLDLCVFLRQPTCARRKWTVEFVAASTSLHEDGIASDQRRVGSRIEAQLIRH